MNKIDINKGEASEFIRKLSLKSGLDFSNRSRKPEYIVPRQALSFVLKEYSSLTSAAIGDLLGGYDNSTVHHSAKTAKTAYQLFDKRSVELQSKSESFLNALRKFKGQDEVVELGHELGNNVQDFLNSVQDILNEE